MRIPIVILATLALGAGGVLGFAAPASAAASFTAHVSSIPTGNSRDTLAFVGSKPSSSRISGLTVTNDGERNAESIDSRCSGAGAGATSWNCSVEPLDPWTVPDSASDNPFVTNTIELVVTNADGTVDHDILTFRVFRDAAEFAPQLSPLTTYRFTQGGVVVSGTPTESAYDPDNPAHVVDQQLYGANDLAENGFEATPVSGCPSRPDSGSVYSNDPAGVNRCSYDALPTLDSGYAMASRQVYNADGYSLGPDSFAYFSVDAAPTITAAVAGVGGSAVVRGTATDTTGRNVVVVDSTGKIVCSTSTFSPAGTWSCTTGALGVGSHKLTASVQDESAGEDPELVYANPDYADDGGTIGYYVNGALSAASNAVTVITKGAVASPVAPLSAPSWSFAVSGDPDSITPGEKLTVTGIGLPAGTTVNSELHSKPTSLGSLVTSEEAHFTETVTIPKGTAPGTHHIELIASGAGLVTSVRTMTITVVDGSSRSPSVTPPAVTPPTGTPPSATITAPKPAGHPATSGRPASIERNILTQALTPIADVAAHPSKIVSAVEIGLVLLLLGILPARLLNATIAEQSERFERRFPRLRSQPRWLAALQTWLASAPVAAGVAVTSAAAILFGFADPAFGFTLASLRLVLACAIALFLVSYAANALTGLIARTQWNIVASVSTRPWGLLLTVVAVIASRLLHFSPGFLVGVILGLTIQGRSAAAYAWRTVAIRSSILLVMGVGAWIGYSSLTLGGDEGGTFFTELLVETLVAITTEGIVALLIELLPLRLLEGQRLFEHSRVLWGGFYLFTVVVFVIAIVPWTGNWAALGSSLGIWVGILALFAALCIGVYVYFRHFAPPLEEVGDDAEIPVAEELESEN